MKADYPFYLAETPFRKMKSVSKWITAALFAGVDFPSAYCTGLVARVTFVMIVIFKDCSSLTASPVKFERDLSRR